MKAILCDIPKQILAILVAQKLSRAASSLQAFPDRILINRKHSAVIVTDSYLKHRRSSLSIHISVYEKRNP